MNQPVDLATLPAMVSLSISKWNQVLEMLGTHPWRDANPLIVDIHRQIEAAAQAAMNPHSEPAPRMDLAA